MALDVLYGSICTILNNGIKHGQLKSGIDVGHLSTVVIASLEGAIMMSKLRGNDSDIKRVVYHLEEIIDGIEIMK